MTTLLCVQCPHALHHFILSLHVVAFQMSSGTKTWLKWTKWRRMQTVNYDVKATNSWPPFTTPSWRTLVNTSALASMRWDSVRRASRLSSKVSAPWVIPVHDGNVSASERQSSSQHSNLERHQPDSRHFSGFEAWKFWNYSTYLFMVKETVSYPFCVCAD